MRRIKKVKDQDVRARKIASGEIVEVVPLTPEQKKDRLNKKIKKIKEKKHAYI